MNEFKDWMELASFIITIVALPFAIAVFIFEQRRERANEEEEIYLKLSDDYSRFMELVLQNSDLKLRSSVATDLTEEQLDRRLALYSILVSLFERAYLLVYEDDMDRKQLRMWRSWEDFMREWCERADFRAALPGLLHGEDPDFVNEMQKLAAEAAQQAGTKPA
ncbi:hypothetical protein VVD49_07470 [Uliginosibacterium sp. H3]|uniref:DUF4760 domain-containing protein n=1 Tax=Uliginosibacterium silvisoli TaxID=3114758 RepID=A0ABU6K3B8_9RHOO|nr:hypothetical protein [Uliginosibacterium sp. H3]